MTTDKQQLRAAQKRVRVLERALRPFVREATYWVSTSHDRYHLGITEPGQKIFHDRAAFTFGDLRRACTLLAGRVLR